MYITFSKVAIFGEKDESIWVRKKETNDLPVGCDARGSEEEECCQRELHYPVQHKS